MVFLRYHANCGVITFGTGDGEIMYLALCEDDKNDLDALCSPLDEWEAEHDANLRREAFQNAEELLESARRERFTL